MTNSSKGLPEGFTSVEEATKTAEQWHKELCAAAPHLRADEVRKVMVTFLRHRLATRPNQPIAFQDAKKVVLWADASSARYALLCGVIAGLFPVDVDAQGKIHVTT